jgi:Restriction endonuclease
MARPNQNLSRVLPLEKLANLAARASTLLNGARHAPTQDPVPPWYESNVEADAKTSRFWKPESLPAESLAQWLGNIDDLQYEKLIGRAYRKLGYKVTSWGGDFPDCGIDLVAEKDDERVAIQCKQGRFWDVDTQTVRKVLNTTARMEIQKSIIITLHGLTVEAKQLAASNQIQTIEGNELFSILKTTGVKLNPKAQSFKHNFTKLTTGHCAAWPESLKRVPV